MASFPETNTCKHIKKKISSSTRTVDLMVLRPDCVPGASTIIEISCVSICKFIAPVAELAPLLHSDIFQEGRWRILQSEFVCHFLSLARD